jgi:hypothetical protein
MPKRPGRQEREPPVPISVELKGVTHKGYYQIEGARSEERMNVTCDGESKSAWLHAMEPNDLARLLLLEIVGKQSRG